MYEYKVKSIKSIYDGDTVVLEVDLGFGVSKLEKFRLAFINAPELRGESRPEGLISRDWLRKQLYNAIEEKKNFRIKTFRDRKGKYGRYIAEIFIDDISINRLMLEEQLAVLY